MHEQITLWECMYETKKITKPIRLIECFAGIGSQYRALQNVFKDKDYNAMKQDLSEMAIYHCCGDSIVVNVLEHIFLQMKEQ